MVNPRVIYSIDARLGGGGIGTTAYYAIWGIDKFGHLEMAFVSSNAQERIPVVKVKALGKTGRLLKYLGAKDSSGLLHFLESILFDIWAAVQLPQAEVFHGWLSMCHATIRKAKQLGMVTVVECASPHPTVFAQLADEEYGIWGVSRKLPGWNRRRVLAEISAADYITTPSAFARSSHIAVGVPNHKILEIEFGSDHGESTPATISRQSAHPFRVVFVGRLTVLKGLPYLLEAWQRLGWHDAELWMVGSMEPDFRVLRKRWANLRGVKWHGYTSQVAGIWPQCDVCVFPSIIEGSALVTYEAMSHGLPVITTPNAGSVIRDGVEGFIIPIRDVGAICDRLHQLRNDPDLRTGMGRAGQDRVREFTWANYGKRLVECYARIIPH
jgi:glycosyltransferase involved in cell wall biosynthesis